MARPWRVALAQAAPLSGPDVLERYEREIAEILAAHEVDMVVHPEIHLCGDADRAGDDHAWLAAAAEPLDGPRVTGLGAVAKRHDVWLVPGSVPERGADGRVYNTAVVLDPAGRLVASYRKVFPWRPYERWASGSEFVVFDVPATGRFGLSICYDSWFPESTRQLAWLGAEVVLNVVKTTGPDRSQELLVARANAIVNQVYFLSVNCAGPVGAGQSIHVDPQGYVLAECPGRDPALTVLALDLDEVTRTRTEGTAGLNRPWEQLQSGDAPIALPAYDGAMVPGRWTPARASEERS